MEVFEEMGELSSVLVVLPLSAPFSSGLLASEDQQIIAEVLAGNTSEFRWLVDRYDQS